MSISIFMSTSMSVPMSISMSVLMSISMSILTYLNQKTAENIWCRKTAVVLKRYYETSFCQALVISEKFSLLTVLSLKNGCGYQFSFFALVSIFLSYNLASFCSFHIQLL